MEKLIIRLLQDGRAEWALYRLGARIARSEQPGRLEDMDSEIPYSAHMAREIVAIVPGVDVLVASTEVPPKQRRHLQRILPFLLEDQLADEVGQMHFAAAPARAGEARVAVAGVKRECMEAWMATLGAAGLVPKVMLPETWLIPEADNAWVLLGEGGMAWLRTSADEVFAVEKAMLPELFSLLAPGKAMRVDCSLAGAQNSMDISKQLQNANSLPLHFSAITSVFDVLAAQCVARPAQLNLLQGAFSAAQQRGREAWLPWAKLVAGGIAAMVAVMVLQAGVFAWQVSALQAEAEAVYREHYPDDAKIIDPVQQMKAHLHVGQDQRAGGFLSLLATLAQYWSVGSNVQMQGLSYQDAVLNGKVSTKRMGVGKGLAEGLQSTEVSAKVVSVVSGKDGFTGQLALTEGAP